MMTIPYVNSLPQGYAQLFFTCLHLCPLVPFH